MALDGRLVLVTGAASGIGRAVCELFTKEGARIAAADVNEAGLQETKSLCTDPSKIVTFKADVSVASEVKNLLKRVLSEFGEAPSVVMNIAGICEFVMILDMAEEQFDRMIQNNLKSQFLIAQACSKLMVEKKIKNGSIVNMSSVAGKAVVPGLSHYCIAKAGIIALTKCVAKEMAEHGIRCNTIMPGAVETPILQAGPPVALDVYCQAIPMKRLAIPKEVADCCLFLASEKSAYMTGACVELTGGLDM